MANTMPYTCWPDMYAGPEPEFDRGNPPFKRGWQVRMRDEGYAVAKGDVVRIDSVRWVETLKEWCVDVIVRGYPVSYRANRFEKVTESDMKEDNLIYAYVEMNEQGERMGSPGVFLAANYKDMEVFIKQQLNGHPRSTFVYGRMDRKAFVDRPPIKIQNI